MKISETRGRKINEIISGIKIVKFNGWEKIMNETLKKFRIQECNLVFKAFGYYNLSHGINSVTATIMGLATFILFEFASDEKLSVSQIYELITLFNAIVTPVRYLVIGFLARVDSINACSRISELLKLKPYEPIQDSPYLPLGAMEIKDGYFHWQDPRYYEIFEKKKIPENSAKNYILKNINLRINPGEFVAVIGRVGSGKTSVLLSLMDEMVRSAGSEVSKNGKIAYISQEAFLRNATIKDNITFGESYSRKKFKETLEICQMMPDLEILPGRELTEIGERGINMSGGQKQRINIARAVYSESDIYLIDDALSALDAYVGKKIMQEVFLEELKGKTRVMVTHFLHLLEDVDKVILVDDGEIKASGSFEEVRQTQAFKIFSNSLDEKQPEEDEDEELIEKSLVKSMLKKESISEENLKLEESLLKEVKESILSQNRDNLNLGKLVEKEKRDTGLVSLSFFGYYMKMAGGTLSFFCILFFLLSITAKLACDWWVGQWMENTFDLSKSDYMIIYGLSGFFVLVLMIIRSIALAGVSQISTLKIFNKVIWNVLRRPMSFFDTTPSGVIINRCTDDVDNLDYVIPWYSSFFFSIAFSFLGSLVLATIVSPVIAILLLISLIVIVKDFKKYFKTAVELKRINQLTASPLISICSEFIEGSTVIRSYGKKEMMLDMFREAVDLNNNAFFHDDASIIWIKLRVEFTVIFVIVAAVFSLVINRSYE